MASRGRSAAAPRLVGPEDAARLLEPGREALLEYSVGDSSSSLWVVTRRGWKRFTLPPRAALATRVEILRRGLASPEGSESRRTRAAARTLYADLVAPALPWLGGVRRLVIAPDGALARIPFEALLAADAPEGAPAPRGAYLAERYAIRYTPSASALAAPATSAPASSGIVAIGDP